MGHELFDNLPSQAQENLACLSKRVDKLLPLERHSWRFETSASEEQEGRLISELSKWANAGNRFLYYFDCISTFIDFNTIKQDFSDAKMRKERKFSRLNTSANGHCLYVGSSQSIAKRFREHLGYGPKTTYALQLSHWARNLSLEIEFVCAKYKENTSSEAMQALEDTLWTIKSPMFGRKGNK